MPIADTTTSSDHDVYFTEAFKVIARSEKEYLISQSTMVTLDKPYLQFACRNDFYRLLRNQGIPAYLFWVTAFLNDVIDPYQSILDMTFFFKVEESTLINLITRANTVAG